jgi:hypothetical protein
MALLIGSSNITAERTGVGVNIPNNDIARLMYYLNAVCYTIDCNNDPDIQRFRDFKNWSYLSFDDQKALVILCYTFSPDVFDNKVFFHSNELCGNNSNQFYTINQVRSQLVAVESIIIAGQARQVNKIMTYTMSWMKNNYFDPIQRLATKLSRPPPAITYPSTTNYPRYTTPVIRQPTKKSSKYSCCCKCCTTFIIICVLVGIGIGIFFILRLRGIIKT